MIMWAKSAKDKDAPCIAENSGLASRCPRYLIASMKEGCTKCEPLCWSNEFVHNNLRIMLSFKKKLANKLIWHVFSISIVGLETVTTIGQIGTSYC